MYNNIGKKIKALAVIGSIILTIVSVLIGMALWIQSENESWVLLMLGGPLVAWISSWLIYGFGEIVDKVCDIEQNTRGEQSKSQIAAITQKADEESKERARKIAAEVIQKAAEEKAAKSSEGKASRKSSSALRILGVVLIAIALVGIILFLGIHALQEFIALIPIIIFTLIGGLVCLCAQLKN